MSIPFPLSLASPGKTGTRIAVFQGQRLWVSRGLGSFGIKWAAAMQKVDFRGFRLLLAIGAVFCLMEPQNFSGTHILGVGSVSLGALLKLPVPLPPNRRGYVFPISFRCSKRGRRGRRMQIRRGLAPLPRRASIALLCHGAWISTQVGELSKEPGSVKARGILSSWPLGV